MGSSHYEACKASIKKYYLKNADKIKELRKIRYNHFKYYHENQERINQYNKLRYHNLKSKIKCEICNNEVVNVYYNKHLNSKKHLKNLLSN
jgi:hypothetical protein